MKINGYVRFTAFFMLVVFIAIFANYLAGALYLLANKTNPFLVTFKTVYLYWQYYADDPHQMKLLHFAAFVGCMLTIIGPISIFLGFKKVTQPLHGDARFATPGEVKKSGLLGNTGIILGKFRGRFLMLAGQLFAWLSAPTRSGKGVGVVIPNLLNFSDSVVALDVKQENYDITSGYRFLYGHEVYMFNPFAEDRRSHRYNFLSTISKDPHYRAGDILAIGFVIYPQDAKDSFWNDQARNLFLGLNLFLCETPELPHTFGEVLRQSSGKGKPVKDYLQDLIAEREESDRPLSDGCVDALNRFCNNSDNTLASILASFNAPLNIFASPIVDAATSASDFSLADVRKKRMSIYLGITPDYLPQSALMLNLFYSQLVNLNVKVLPIKDKSLKYQCLMLLDEFTAMGKVAIIAKAVSFMAGYNLRMLVIVQSIAQVAGLYGNEDARTMTTNHAAQVIFPPREQKDANEYSEMLGYLTQKSVSTGRSGPTTAFRFGKGSDSENVSDQKRALMLPQELKEMAQDKEIIIVERTKPIMAEKIFYYKERVFMDRLKEVSPTLRALGDEFPDEDLLKEVIASGELSVPVPKLDLDLHVAIVESRKRNVEVRDLPGLLANDGVNLDLLANDFENLPELDDEDNPSPESVKALVSDFFGRLNTSPDPDDSEGFEEAVDPSQIDLSALDGIQVDGDGVIDEQGGYLPMTTGGVDLSALDMD